MYWPQPADVPQPAKGVPSCLCQHDPEDVRWPGDRWGREATVLPSSWVWWGRSVSGVFLVWLAGSSFVQSSSLFEGQQKTLLPTVFERCISQTVWDSAQSGDREIQLGGPCVNWWLFNLSKYINWSICKWKHVYNFLILLWNLYGKSLALWTVLGWHPFSMLVAYNWDTSALQTSDRWKTEIFGKPRWPISGPFRVVKDRNLHVVTQYRPFSEIQTVRITFKLRSITFKLRKNYVNIT